MSNNGGNGVNFLAGVILGAAIGAGVAVLIAPENGEETRKKVLAKSKKLILEAKQMADEIKTTKIDPNMEKMNARMQEAEREVEDRVNRARNAAARRLEVKTAERRAQ